MVESNLYDGAVQDIRRESCSYSFEARHPEESPLKPLDRFPTVNFQSYVKTLFSMHWPRIKINESMYLNRRFTSLLVFGRRQLALLLAC